MRENENKKRRYIIIGLCAIVTIMAIGFAAFSQQLQINSTSEVTSSWDVHIKDNGVSYKNAVGATSTLAEKTSALVATFACTLSTPGTSTISYDVIVENKGTLNAKLDSIELTGGNTAISVVTSPTNASLATSPIVLGPDDETTITVIVSYNDILTQPTGDGAVTNITAHLNFSQTNDSPSGVVSGFTGTIYSKHSNTVSIGDSIVYDPGIERWEGDRSGYYYDTEQECADAGNKSCGIVVEGESGIESYTEDSSTLNSNYYLKHTVVNNIVTENYVCFVSDTEHCMKAGIDECEPSDPNNEDSSCTLTGEKTVFNANTQIIQGYQTYYASQNPSCNLNYYNSSRCYGGGLYVVSANNSGTVEVGESYMLTCYADSSGRSSCFEF